jgi:hypothetical protein
MVKTWNTVFMMSGYTWNIPPERMMQLQNDATAGLFTV